jgi:hypothetical protein
VASQSALHLIENRLDVAAAGPQWTSSSRLPRSILAIAAGADFEHLALPRYRPDRSISLDKGVSHRDSLAKYAVAYFECMTWPLTRCSIARGAATAPRSVRRFWHDHFGGRETRPHRIGVKYEPGYVDVAVKRWQRSTKLEATLTGDGRSFEEIGAARSNS